MVIILLFIGLIVGSAANALIDRLPRKESWASGRSHCDKCKHVLNWYDLIPVFSYLTLLGKCRYCHSPIPVRNLIVELIMAVGFLSIFNFQFLIFNQYSIFKVVILLLIFWISVIIAVMDWETQLVSEVLVLLWGILVVADKFLISNSLINLNNSLYGLLIGVGLIGGIWALSKGRAMGFGDVEIAAVMGFWLGWPNIMSALQIAFVSGAIIGIVQVLRHKNKMKGQIAFGTFLILGTWIAYFWGDMILKKLYG